MLLGTWLGSVLSVFWFFFASLGAKKTKKHSKNTPEPVPQKHSKSIPWGTFRPRPLVTPVNGGRIARQNAVTSLCRKKGEAERR